MIHQVLFGKHAVSAPAVVGTVSTARTLSQIATDSAGCDIVEVRYDTVGGDVKGVLDACRRLTAADVPVVFTLRLASEGGNWTAADSARREILLQALPFVTAVDIELQSVLLPAICEPIRSAQCGLILSYHNFTQTPNLETLTEIVDRAAAFTPSIVKIATMPDSSRDLGVLMELLDRNADTAMSVMAMGPLGTGSRIFFPVMGSCLTYGFMDSVSAPGQLESRVLVERLKEIHPGYATRHD